jgi:hypothetical protein
VKDLVIFSCEAHGSTLIIAHGEVVYIDSDGVACWYNEEEKARSLWLEVAAGRVKASKSWKRIV